MPTRRSISTIIGILLQSLLWIVFLRKIHVGAFIPHPTLWRVQHLAQELPTTGTTLAPALIRLSGMSGTGLPNKRHDVGGRQGHRHHRFVRFLRTFTKSLLKGLALPLPILQKIAFSIRDDQEKERHHFFSIGISVREGLLALFVYLLTGVIVYTKVLEHWSVVDALYFSSVCFSTVGYGDLCPTNAASRLFTCMFGMVGIAFLGAAVAVVGGKVVQAEVVAARTAGKISKRRLMQLFDFEDGHFLHRSRKHPTDQQNKAPCEQEVQKSIKDFQEKITKEQLHHESSLLRIVRRLTAKSLSSLTIIFIGGLIMRHLNKTAKSWSIQQALYFSLVTGTYNAMPIHALS